MRKDFCQKRDETGNPCGLECTYIAAVLEQGSAESGLFELCGPSHYQSRSPSVDGLRYLLSALGTAGSAELCAVAHYSAALCLGCSPQLCLKPG